MASQREVISTAASLVSTSAKKKKKKTLVVAVMTTVGSSTISTRTSNPTFKLIISGKFSRAISSLVLLQKLY